MTIYIQIGMKFFYTVHICMYLDPIYVHSYIFLNANTVTIVIRFFSRVITIYNSINRFTVTNLEAEYMSRRALFLSTFALTGIRIFDSLARANYIRVTNTPTCSYKIGWAFINDIRNTAT